MTDTSNPSGSELSAAPAVKTSVWEDFVDIFASPSEVFARRQNSSFWLPMIVVAVVIGILFVATKGLMQPVMDAEFARGAAAAMRKNPQLTEEQMQSMRAMTEKFSVVIPFIFVPIGIFLTGLFLWLIGKLFDATETLRTALVVTAYAFVIRVVEIVVNVIQLALLDSSTLTSHYALTLGVGRFLNPDGSPFALALLGRVDVFTIWITVLLAIGLSVTGKIPRSRAYLAAACVWLLGALPALVGALRS